MKAPLDRQTLDSMTEDDWQARLSPLEYHVLRQKGTERPFTGRHTDNTDDGVYVCRGCGLALFDSDHKFHSGCGWPSFDKSISPTALIQTPDHSYGMSRTEVSCSACGGHLGHVFDDGPPETTGLRYCINSVAIHFYPTNTKECL